MKPPVQNLVFESVVDRAQVVDRALMPWLSEDLKMHTLCKFMLWRGASAEVRQVIREALNAS